VFLGIALAALRGGESVVTFCALWWIFPEQAAGWYFADSGWFSLGAPTIAHLALPFILVVISGPLFEEIVFRRCAFAWMAARWGVRFGAIVSSVLFAAVHVGTIPVAAFGFGLVACLIYLEDWNLSDPLLLHATTNVVSFAVTAALALRAPYSVDELVDLNRSLLYPGVLGVLVGGGIVTVELIRQWPRARGLREAV
jgi:membrane protease YdiL (CAAX protease family)